MNRNIIYEVPLLSYCVVIYYILQGYVAIVVVLVVLLLPNCERLLWLVELSGKLLHVCVGALVNVCWLLLPILRYRELTVYLNRRAFMHS